MRSRRTDIENFYIAHFLEYVCEISSGEVSELPDITDQPDLALKLGEQRISVELSQFPSSYIMQELHKSRDSMDHQESTIHGHVVILPFEPHRWVHEVISAKGNKIPSYRERVSADEVWLLMHGMSTRDDWPMSSSEHRKSREAEALLLRFGTGRSINSFDQVFFVYCDGEVVVLQGSGITTPTQVSLPQGSGYPAVTTHHFFLNIDIPTDDQSPQTLTFDDIEFEETVVTPVDEWMARRPPDIDRPTFRALAVVTPTSITLTVFRDSAPMRFDPIDITAHGGGRVSCHCVLTWSIKRTTFTSSAVTVGDYSQ